MPKFEAKSEQLKLVNYAAKETYRIVATKREIKMGEAHRSPFCVNLASNLADLLPSDWNPVVNEQFEVTGSGESPTYGHCFIEIDDYVIDPGWQLFLPDGGILGKIYLWLFPKPKVLVSKKTELASRLKKFGVPIADFVNWGIK